MANRALIKYYAKLIQEDRMALGELLPSVRQDVENYLNGKGFQPRHSEEIPLSTEVYEEKMGAMHLPNLYLYMNKNVKGTRHDVFIGVGISPIVFLGNIGFNSRSTDNVKDPSRCCFPLTLYFR